MKDETTGLTVRLPAEMAQALRVHAFLTETSINDTIKRAVAEYLEQHGRAEMVDAAFDRVMTQHATAIEKLRDL